MILIIGLLIYILIDKDNIFKVVGFFSLLFIIWYLSSSKSERLLCFSIPLLFFLYYVVIPDIENLDFDGSDGEHIEWGVNETAEPYKKKKKFIHFKWKIEAVIVEPSDEVEDLAAQVGNLGISQRYPALWNRIFNNDD